MPAVALTCTIVYVVHGFHGTLTRDLAVYSYAGQQVAVGVPPYLGILNRAGPLAHALPAVGVLLARPFGFDDVVTMRVVFMLVAVAGVCAGYVLGRDVFSSRASGLATAGALLACHGYIQYAADGPREKTPMTLFIVLALWAVTRHRWFSAGMCVSLATLCLQTAFPSTAAAVVVGVLLLASEGRVRALARVAAGGLLPVVVLGAWFAASGSLHAAVEGFYLINARYTVPDPVTDALPDVWLDLQAGYGVTLWLLLGGMVALLLRALTALWPPSRRSDPALHLLPAMAVGLLVGLLWTLKDYDAWPDLFTVLPFSALGVGAALDLVARRSTPNLRLVVTAVVSAGAVVLALLYSWSARDQTLDAQQRDVDAVVAQLPRSATITSIEAPQPLVLTGRTNPTRYQMFRGGLQDYMQDHWPGGLPGFQRDLVARHPDLVAVGETVSHRWRASIEPDYVYIGSAPVWDWYARASLGPARIAALRKAAKYDPSDPLARPETSSR